MSHAPRTFLFLVSAVVLFIFIIYHNVVHKETGSFEYVRKGERLLDKEKYAESIRYFEKAYELSPENETIKSDLIYAYSTYSRNLAEKEKYDEALDYMIKAYKAAPNASTKQNLASAYAEKALHEAQKGGLTKAKDTYAKVREYGRDPEAVARNIGIILYNDGVNEYRSGREDTALLCLKQSSLINKEARVFDMLGDIYYKSAFLRMARFYWHEAKKLNPRSKPLQVKLNRIIKEMPRAARDEKSILPHFEISYEKNLQIDKKLAAEIFEKAYADVGRDLAYFPKERTKIFFYSKEDFKNIFHMPFFVKAFYDGSIKVPAPEKSLDGESFTRYIYHEYAHAIVSAKTNNNCPPWLSEGIAVWQESKIHHDDVKKILVNIKEVPEISIRFMENSFKTEEMSKNKALSYMLSYTLVDFILNNWGTTGLQNILSRLAKKQHIINALDDEFLLSEKEFERRWHSFIDTAYNIK